MIKTLRIKVVDDRNVVHFNRVYNYDFTDMDQVRDYAGLCMDLKSEYSDCFISIVEEK